MPLSPTFDAYMSALLAGQRDSCRNLVKRQLEDGPDAESLYQQLLWPAMERLEKLYRADRINTAAEHMATRINRSIADQLQSALTRHEPVGKRVLITCADGEPEELGAQMTADLFEARGWEVFFLGGGVPNDEVLHLAGQLRPHLLLIFGTQPSGVPGVRHLIDLIRNIGVNPTMNIMVSGGVFNRADGLWLEVHADFHARTATEALSLAAGAEPRTPTPMPTNGVKKRRRRRRTPVGAENC